MQESNIHNRKDDHIKIALDKNAHKGETSSSNWLEYIHLIHNALPELNFGDIDCSTTFFNKKISAPIILGALTGGTAQAKEINSRLAHVAQEYNLPMMLGSQRIALENPNVIDSFHIVREVAPTIPLIGNIGITQLIQMESFDKIDSLIRTIEVDALAIHVNPLQELIQPNGDTDFSGAVQKIHELNDYISVPLIVKETGAGFSKEIVKKLISCGVSMIDVAGSGGTSFAKIESIRAEKEGSMVQAQVGSTYSDWGIPTAATIFEARSAIDNFEFKTRPFLIGSGGIRTGQDILKALTIGSDYVAIAGEILKNAVESQKMLNQYVKTLISELKTGMFLTGARQL
ncbi:MAG: type 2 isopentenyl-diphosphate Delta-isomerase, partial [Promethearchaeota archaeon]